MNIQKLFEQNLKYLRQSELEPDIQERQFVETETRGFLTVGTVDILDGKVRVGDPFAYMCGNEFSPEFNKSVTPGVYPVEIAISKTAVAGIRICAARVKFKTTRAVRYDLAEPTETTAAMKCSDGLLPHIPVDAGMLAFISAEGMEDYVKFIEQWRKKNPKGNLYNDYFAGILAKSAEKLPQFQRGEGDFAEWVIPGTKHKLVMLTSGLGDGLYRCFWGIDEAGEICELTMPLINADLLDKANEQYLDIWAGPPICMVTNHIAEGGGIGYLRRDTPSDSFPDSGWAFYGRGEDEDYWNDTKNFSFMDIHDLAERFPDIVPILNSPIGTAYFVTDEGEFILDDFED